MSSTIAGTLRIKSPYEFGANHAGPIACELMDRYPDLVIRIDVEHGIVSPVVENYDIVFAMLEAPLPSTGIVIKRVSSLKRGLYAAPSLLEKFGEPLNLQDLARLPVLTGPNDAPWSLTTPSGVTEHLEVQKARLVSSNADIRLQAALAGHGVLRVTASFTNDAIKAGTLRRLLPDHICEPLNVHALLPARQFVPAKVRCFLDALPTHDALALAHGARVVRRWHRAGLFAFPVCPLALVELGDSRLDLLRRHRVYPFMKEWFGKNYFPVLLFGFRSLPAAAPLRERRS